MFDNITQVKKAHKAQGGHFFDPQAMRFFNSKVESKVYAGRYFVTSERCGSSIARSKARFTVREVAPEGEIVGDLFGFQFHDSLEGALIALGKHIGRVAN